MEDKGYSKKRNSVNALGNKKRKVPGTGMNIKIEYVEENEEEIILRIQKSREESTLRFVREYMEEDSQKFCGVCNGETIFYEPSQVYYMECVDGRIFAYLEKKICAISQSLEKMEQVLGDRGFFRCSKSMLLNLNYIDRFQSTMGNRITATLLNGEQVVFSRHYAKLLRAYLKEGREYE